MIVSIKINSLVGRSALAAAVLLMGGAFIGIVLSHYVVRTVADRRILMGKEVLAAAAAKVPNSPRIHFRLAEAAVVEPVFEPGVMAQARNQAMLAARLSPWDYRLWRLLGAAQEMNGETEAAEKSLRTAAKLAPSFVDVNWALANLLLREGKLNEAMAPFQVAVKSNSDLLPTAFELVWQASSGDVNSLTSLTTGEAEPMLKLTQFLSEQGQTEAAVSIFRQIDARDRLKSQSAASFVTSLIAAGQVSMARELWLDTVEKARGDARSGLIWNGSFELELLKGFSHFDWTITNSNYARIGIDSEVAHGGKRSFKVIFAGKDTTKLEGELKQLLALKPNTKYRLECFARALNLVTPEGPRLALLGRNGVIAVSEPVAAGSTGWQSLAVTFTSFPESTVAYVTVVRQPRFSYDEPTRGTIWFDDFKLTEL